MVRMVAPTRVAPTGTRPAAGWISRRDCIAVLCWTVLIAIGTAGGYALNAMNVKIVLWTPPLLGDRGLSPRAHFLLPIACAAVIIVALPRVLRSWTWPGAVLASVGAAAAWTCSLALVEGTSGFTRGISEPGEYLQDVPYVQSHAGDFLQHFTRDISNYGTHVRGHPPGMVLLLAAMRGLGLGGAGWEAVLVIAAGISTVAAVAIAVRNVAGEDVARRALPWLALSPAAIWIASSADALYAALGAWCVCLVVLASATTGTRSVILAVCGGLAGGAALMGSYGMALIAIPAVVVAIDRRRVGPCLVAAGSAFLVLLAFVPFGFWWLDGLHATVHEYQVLDVDRPYWYFVVNNLAAWALTLGPAIAVAIARPRHRELWLLGGGAMAAALAADISGLSLAEVERIWLPFTVWVLALGAALTTSVSATRAWMAVQAAAAIGLLFWIRPHW